MERSNGAGVIFRAADARRHQEKKKRRVLAGGKKWARYRGWREKFRSISLKAPTVRREHLPFLRV